MTGSSTINSRASGYVGGMGGYLTSSFENSQNGVGQASGLLGLENKPTNNHSVPWLLFAIQDGRHIGPHGEAGNKQVWPVGLYVRAAGYDNFPDAIRVYDRNSFCGSTFGHSASPSLRTRFLRACRAFVNAWRQA